MPPTIIATSQTGLVGAFGTLDRAIFVYFGLIENYFCLNALVSFSLANPVLCTAYDNGFSAAPLVPSCLTVKR